MIGIGRWSLHPMRNGLVEFDTKGFPLVEVACLLDECMSKVGVDSPVANLVGVGQVLRETELRRPIW